ncbi:helix-turn-helix transcriptional regulator [Vibrio parahaemolyticus]|nr:helix-turn-helix transcriptional regulator [Vibrio parahaemolyticus]
MKALAIQSGEVKDFLIKENNMSTNRTVDSILNALYLSKSDSASLIESKIQDKARENLNLLWEQYSERENITRSTFCKSIGWTTTSNFSAYLKGTLPLGDSVIDKIASGLDVEPQMIKYDFNHAEFKSFLKEKRSSECGLSSEKMKKVAKNIKMRWQEYQDMTGMTQQEFCQSKLGLKTQAGFSQIINGKAPVNNELLIKLATAFSCTVTDLSPDAEIDSEVITSSDKVESDAVLLIRDMMDMLQCNGINVSLDMQKRIELVINS